MTKLNRGSDSRPLSTAWVILVGVLVVGLLFSGCTIKHAARVNVAIVYPHECITSDIVCHPHGKKMGCSFDKLKSCAVMKVESK